MVTRLKLRCIEVSHYLRRYPNYSSFICKVKWQHFKGVVENVGALNLQVMEISSKGNSG